MFKSDQKLKVLYVEDDVVFARTMTGILLEKYDVVTVYTLAEALRQIPLYQFDIIILDKFLPDCTIPESIIRFKQMDATACILVLTGDNDFSSFNEALEAGALDYVVKPTLLSESTLGLFATELFARVQKANHDCSQVRRNEILEDWIKQQNHISLIGRSQHIQDVRKKIVKYQRIEAPVLITGETGTGKDVIARSLHFQDFKQLEHFVAINCSAIPDHLLESTLFGYKKGAFTGAFEDRPGILAKANGGTLFLDEVGDLTLGTQVKLLRVLESREYSPVGSMEVKQAHFRLICATHKNLSQLIQENRFREDFFYRISSLPIETIPLRDRPEDILDLGPYFLILVAGNCYNLPNKTLTFMQSLKWSGNIRELKSSITLAFVNARSDGRVELLPQDFERRAEVHSKVAPAESFPKLPCQSGEVTPEQFSLFRRLVEKIYIENALTLYEGDITRTHTSLGISRATLYQKLRGFDVASASTNMQLGGRPRSGEIERGL